MRESSKIETTQGLGKTLKLAAMVAMAGSLCLLASCKSNQKPDEKQISTTGENQVATTGEAAPLFEPPEAVKNTYQIATGRKAFRMQCSKVGEKEKVKMLNLLVLHDGTKALGIELSDANTKVLLDEPISGAHGFSQKDGKSSATMGLDPMATSTNMRAQVNWEGDSYSCLQNDPEPKKTASLKEFMKSKEAKKAN